MVYGCRLWVGFLMHSVALSDGLVHSGFLAVHSLVEWTSLFLYDFVVVAEIIYVSYIFRLFVCTFVCFM